MKLGGSAFAQSLGKIGDEVPTVQDAEYFRDAFLAVQELVNKGLILAGHDISAGGLITTLLEMCFANVEGGMEINLDKMKEHDLVKLLFAENPGIVIQVSDKHKEEVKQILEDAGVGFVKIGSRPTNATSSYLKMMLLISSVSTICVMFGILLLTCSTASNL